jgi:hypothetical protein
MKTCGMGGEAMLLYDRALIAIERTALIDWLCFVGSRTIVRPLDEGTERELVDLSRPEPALDRWFRASVAALPGMLAAVGLAYAFASTSMPG